MSRRYEFDEGGYEWADTEDLDYFEGDIKDTDEFLILGNPYGSAYVFHGTRQQIATQLREMLHYVETTDPWKRVTDPQDPLLTQDPVTEEFMYFHGEQWITVEPHTHEMEDHGSIEVCYECPFMRPKDDDDAAE